MTTELILLMSMFVFILLGGFVGNKGPRVTFNQSAPRLAGRIERDLATGGGFQDGRTKQGIAWKTPLHGTDTGELK